jgi:hypothetical protein
MIDVDEERRHMMAVLLPRVADVVASMRADGLADLGAATRRLLALTPEDHVETWGGYVAAVRVLRSVATLPGNEATVEAALADCFALVVSLT